MKGYLKTLKRCFVHTKSVSIWLWLALLMTVLSTIGELIVPVLTGMCIDCIIGVGQVDFTGLTKYGLMLLGVVGVTTVVTWLSTFLTSLYMHKSVEIIRGKFFSKIQSVPIRYVDNNNHGDLLSRIINDTETMADGFLEGISMIFNGVITILGTFVFMVSLNITITLIIVLLTPLSLFIALYIAKKSNKLFRAHAKTRGAMTGYLEELIGGQRIVKAFNHEEDSIEAFEVINEKNRKVAESAEFYSSITNPITRFMNGLVYVAVGFTGALLALNGKVTVGRISTFLSYSNSFGKPFNEISSEIATIQAAFASAERIFQVLDAKDEPSDVELPELGYVDGSVKVEKAYFSYLPKQKLLQNLNLDIKPGQKIAIVGPTGCGKTTFINLLMRFYDLTDGTIYLGDTDITKIKRSSLRNQYGMVLQESWMFNTTIRDNIAYGKPNATLEDVITAAKAAGAHEFIERLPNGYDTIITEGGNNISQGQKQLLCIARIMLIKPPMLILDEATSNIDTRTEIKIQQAFDTMMEGRTSFIVAHRLSTIKNADMILVMNKGNIIEKGTHNELMKKGGFYANLYNSQFANTTE